MPSRSKESKVVIPDKSSELGNPSLNSKDQTGVRSKETGLFENIDFGGPTVNPHETALYVDGLTKTFDSGDNEIRALDGVSFTAKPGEVVGLLGPNGAGKTTAIKAILGLVLPDRGDVRIQGIDPYDRPRQAYKHVDAMFEGARNDYWRLTVEENLRYFAAIRGQKPEALADRHEDLLERFGISDKADTQVRNLSRGMKQKVSLASILASDVSIAFLDEPTLGLDVESSLQLRTELTRLAREESITMLICSHEMEVIEDVCDRVVIMSGGRVLANDSIENLLSKFDTKGYRIVTRGINENTLSYICQYFDVDDIEQINGNTRFVVNVNSNGFYKLTDVMERQELELVSIESVQPDLQKLFLEITSNNQLDGDPRTNGWDSS